MDDPSATTDVEHGVVIIATGAEELKPEEYLYGQRSPGVDSPGPGSEDGRKRSPGGKGQVHCFHPVCRLP